MNKDFHYAKECCCLACDAVDTVRTLLIVTGIVSGIMLVMIILMLLFVAITRYWKTVRHASYCKRL